MSHFFGVLITAAIFGSVGAGQTIQNQIFAVDSTSRAPEKDGLRLYDVSVFSAYATSAFPLTNQGYYPVPGISNLRSDINYGALVSGGWQHHRARTTVSIRYTLSYFDDLRYSSLSALGHDLALGLNRELTNKWTINLSASGQDATVYQYVFQPSPLSQISSTSASFSDLAGAVSGGQLSNLPNAAWQGALLGYRILTYNATLSASYALSKRLSLEFGSFAVGGESRHDKQYGGFQSNYVMPATVGGTAGVSLNYELSPRTTLGLNLMADGLSNQFQRATGGTGTASLTRRMGMHWLLRGYAGGFYMDSIQQTYGAPRSRQVVGGGSMAFKTYGNTWVGSFNRSGYDAGAFALGTNTNTSGAWIWHRPSSGWTLQASVSRWQITGNGYSSLSGWQAMGSANRRLFSNLLLSASYVHLDTRGSYLGSYPLAVKFDSIRLAFSWVPALGL